MDSDEQLFLRVVDAGSLKAAAAQLITDPSTVSRRLARLEARLGVKLLQRSTRRSLPTDAGAQYYEGLRQLIEQQQALEAHVAGAAKQPRGRLRVTAPVEFGARFVVPVIERLYSQAPELEIELDLGSGVLDLLENGIDVAIRVGSLSDSPLIARKLAEVPRVLVAAPCYLERRGTPQKPADLADHDFILYKPGHRNKAITLIGPEGPETVRVYGRISVNSVSGIVSLVAAGAGIHFGPMWAFHRAIQEHQLCALLPDCDAGAYPVHALYAPSAYVAAKIRVFVDLLAEHFRRDPALMQT